MVFRNFLIVLIPLIWATGCGSSTEFTKNWKDPAFKGQAFREILVVGMSSDNIARGNMEGSIVKAFSQYGIRGRMGMEVFPPLLFKEKLSKEEAKDRVKQSGADAVLLISLLDAKDTEWYVPGAVVYTPAPGSMAMYGYWSTSWNTIYTQGYYGSTREYVLQANLYTTADEKLIWSARSTTTDPSSLESFSKTYSGMIVERMVRDTTVIAPGR
jgi:hypothetical protein